LFVIADWLRRSGKTKSDFVKNFAQKRKTPRVVRGCIKSFRLCVKLS
jgi:hypothetical protein